MSDEEIEMLFCKSVKIATDTVDEWWEVMKQKHPEYANDDPNPWMSGYISGFATGCVNTQIAMKNVVLERLASNKASFVAPGDN